MKRPSSAWFKAALVLSCLLVMFSSTGTAKDVRLEDFAVTNNRDDLFVFLKVKGAFKKEMEEAVLNGIPTTFSFFISLEKERPFWFDKKIASKKVNHTIKYNNLKNEFAVRRSWGGKKPVTTESFEKAKELMSEIKSLKLAPLDKLQKGKSYQVKAKAELNKVTLPFNLHYIFFFTALWDFETDWHTFEFEY